MLVSVKYMPYFKDLLKINNIKDFVFKNVDHMLKSEYFGYFRLSKTH